MKKTSFLVNILFAVAMVSCNEVPEDVKSRTEEARTDIYAEAELEKISVNSLQTDTEAALQGNYSQFKLRDGIKVEIPSELYECSFVQAEGYEKKTNEVFSKLYDSDLLSKVKIEKSEWLENPNSSGTKYKTTIVGFRSEELKEHCFLHSSGFLCFIRPDAFDNQCLEICKAIYFADRGDDLSDRYELNGGTVSIAEAINTAQKWVDEKYAYLEPQYTFKVKDVVVRSNEFGEISLDVDVEKCYKGVHLDSAVNQTEDSKNGLKMKDVTNTLMLQIRKPNEICYFTNGSGMILPTETEKLDKVISLSSILPYLTKKFADFSQTMKISEISLKYTLSPQYDYENFEMFFHPGNEVKSKLVWEILFDVPVEGRPDSHRAEGRLVKYIQIDAKTGELEYDFDPYGNGV